MCVACVVAVAWVVSLGACSPAEDPDPFSPTDVSEGGATILPDGAVSPAPTPGGGSMVPSDAGARPDAATGPVGTDAGQGATPGGSSDGGGAGPATRDAAASSDGSTPSSTDAGPKNDAGSASDGGSSSDSGGVTPGNPGFPPITNGFRGFATRYWDCCKPHCGWTGNVTGSPALATCNKSDGSWGSNFNEQSACQGGGAFMCQGNAPWSVSNSLAFGYAAVSARGDICGKCYQLQFTGSSHNSGNDPGSAALAGKTMVVQATNTGGDVGAGQFDLLIPGGGVGQFNACSNQWGVGSSELGATYGGFLATCKQQMGAGNHAGVKSCVMQRCTSVFGARGLTKLEAGCRWFVEWFQVADNPALVYKEVACPQELKSRGMNRNTSGSNSCSI